MNQDTTFTKIYNPDGSVNVCSFAVDPQTCMNTSPAPIPINGSVTNALNEIFYNADGSLNIWMVAGVGIVGVAIWKMISDLK